MSTRSEAGSAPTVEDRRLHPLSWLFVLLQQLRSFAVPLVLLLVTGRGGSGAEWYGLIGVVGLTVVSVAQYFTFRYRADADGFVIRSGVLQRNRRDIPYERVHTVNLHQTLLHRLFGVTEVRLESAGSKQAEAVMRVLSIEDARALESFLREQGALRRSARDPAGAAASEEVAEVPLLALGTAEVVRLGLISNRGMVVIAAGVGALWQVAGDRLSADLVPTSIMTIVADAGRFVTGHLHDTAVLALSAAVLLVILLAIVRVLSVLLALLQYHGFSLVEVGPQLRVERGLLTRVRHQLPRRRIQAWRIDETLLHRWFGRQGLRVDSAAGGEGDDHAIRHLAPVAPPSTVTGLLQRLIGEGVWPAAEWRAVHPAAWRRLFVVPSVGVVIATAVATWQFGWIALAMLGIIPLLVYRARRLARLAGYAIASYSVLVREGWLSRRWGIVDIRKVQALRLTASPLDRRHGMATLWLDSAGAGATEGVLRVRFLPVADAQALYDRLMRMMDAERAA